MLRALVAAGLLWLAFAGIASADRAWLPPETLTPPGTRGLGHVAVAADGTIVLAWVQQLSDWTQDPDYGSRTMVAVVRPGDREIRPVELERQNSGSSTMAANSRGDAVVVWHDLYGWRLEASRLIAGTGAFLPPEPLPGPPQITSSISPVAINENGDVAVVDRDHRAYEQGASFFGWIAPAGLPFGPARLLGEHVDFGMGGLGDVAIGPDGRATLLYDDVPYIENGWPNGPARIGAETWSALPLPSHHEWVHAVPEGEFLGCAGIGMDARGRAAAQWLDGPSLCYGRDSDEDGPMQIAWRDADEEDFGAPQDGPERMTQTLDGLSVSGLGEALTFYRPAPWARRTEAHVATAEPFRPLAERQSFALEPLDADLSADGHGLAVLADRPSTDSYAASLAVARRAPGGPFGPLESLRTDCAPGSIWSHGAIGDGGGQAAVLTQENESYALRLHRDAEVPPHTKVACDGSMTVEPPAPRTEVPLPGLPPVSPPLPPGAVSAVGDGVVLGAPRIARAGRLRTVTLDVRCSAACDVAGHGRLVEGVRVLSRARGSTHAAAGKKARLRLRFRLSRRAARAVRAKRRAVRFTFDLAVRRRGAPPTSHRLVARAR